MINFFSYCIKKMIFSGSPKGRIRMEKNGKVKNLYRNAKDFLKNIYIYTHKYMEKWSIWLNKWKNLYGKNMEKWRVCICMETWRIYKEKWRISMEKWRIRLEKWKNLYGPTIF